MRFFNLTLMATSALLLGNAFAGKQKCSATITNMKTGNDLGRGTVPYDQPHYIAGYTIYCDSSCNLQSDDISIWNGFTVSCWIVGPVSKDLAPRGDLHCIQYI
ncbi:hypothetical protein M0657_011596 [Pyricularia oryzae]|uniref:Uncharacterized protein n=2 Tax=Pyricularia oryzae TaxID=318829 RepID=A0AA97PK81_PYRO3|nr:hypothetical protein OOU_Y34scaffold00577g5 [Pyricularia oryzae Y34]KAI7909950.1 hypothetical protein M0657_011596 [Pyricularia oryzae]